MYLYITLFKIVRIVSRFLLIFLKVCNLCFGLCYFCVTFGICYKSCIILVNYCVHWIVIFLSIVLR
jgi:hypothetical protein